ncbi:nuclear transport factor 2 family protein [Aurantibacter crassamenti]|uniref:nuclear transport factor 2 family protein n=1 Tax=Aurantibacter crassamenti TaxID=1837375 RepID=UPI00193976C2|nr:nuclear transport factor 2 family protein [Aurantibacter crassamenti]MBM1105452.1 nuclear transport factor 2 family protein [Aurantibacter crassamenti]
MDTKDVANKLVAWCKEGDFQSPYQELYSPNIVSIENDGTSEGGRVEGFEGIKQKGEWWAENFEVHNTTVSEPTVAENWFAVKFEMDTTHRPSGMRSTTSEIAVYEVKDGKIVKEQFFYDEQ